MSIIKKQALLSTIFSYGGVVIGFITQFFVVPNVLSESQNGLLGVLLSYMYVLVQLSSLGFNAAGSRFFPYFRDSSKGHRGFLFLGLSSGLIGFLVSMLGLFMLKDWLVNSQEKSNLFADNFHFLIPITFATLLFNLFDNYAKNLYDTVTGTFLSQFLQKLLFLISLLLLVFKYIEFEQYLYFWALAISFYVVPMIWKASRLDGFSLKPDFSVFSGSFSREFWFYSFLTILTGFSSMVILYIDKAMLAKLTSLDETGIYNTASFFPSVMGMALIALNKASQPIIAESFAKHDFGTIQSIYRKSCLTLLIIGCWIFLGIYLNIDSLFHFLPPAYSSGKWVIIIISLGKLFDLATGLNGTILTLSKYYRYDTYIMVGLILITILLNYLLIPHYGMNGAAIALAFATIYFNLARFGVVWWKLGMQPFSPKLLIVLFFAIITIFSIHFLPNFDDTQTFSVILAILVRSSCLTILFGSLIYFSKISPELNEMFNHILKKVFYKINKNN